jgi:two-component sensor histidine kinase
MRLCLLILMGLCLGSSLTYGQNALRPLQPHKLSHANNVYRQAVATRDSALMAEAYYLYGKIYEASGRLAESHRWFLRSLRIQQARGDSPELARLYDRLAADEIELDNYARAKQYTLLNLGVAQRLQAPRPLSLAYTRLYHFYMKSWQVPMLPAQPDSALYYLRLAEQYSRQAKDTLHWAYIAINYGGRLLEQKNVACLEYLQRAQQLYRQCGEYRGQAQAQGLYLLAEAQHTFGQTTAAEATYQEAKRIRAKFPFEKYLSNVELLISMSRYSAATGRWNDAYQYLLQAHDAEIAELQQDRNGAVARLNVAYETEKKEALIQTQRQTLTLQQATQTAQRRLLWALAVFLTGTIAASVVFFRLSRKNKRISERNAELVREQNHRVKNNLQVLSSLLNLQANRLSDPLAKTAIEESQLRVETMAILQRRLYDGEELVTLQAQDFVLEISEMVLNTFGLGDIITITAHIDPMSLTADDSLRVGLILNELLTNACKYAFADHDTPQLRIAFSKVQKQYYFELHDNGPGITLDAHGRPAKHSFGMRLIELQVAQLDGSYQFDNQQGTKFLMFFSE